MSERDAREPFWLQELKAKVRRLAWGPPGAEAVASVQGLGAVPPTSAAPCGRPSAERSHGSTQRLWASFTSQQAQMRACFPVVSACPKTNRPRRLGVRHGLQAGAGHTPPGPPGAGAREVPPTNQGRETFPGGGWHPRAKRHGPHRGRRPGKRSNPRAGSGAHSRREDDSAAWASGPCPVEQGLLGVRHTSSPSSAQRGWWHRREKGELCVRRPPECWLL